LEKAFTKIVSRGIENLACFKKTDDRGLDKSVYLDKICLI